MRSGRRLAPWAAGDRWVMVVGLTWMGARGWEGGWRRGEVEGWDGVGEIVGWV